MSEKRADGFIVVLNGPPDYGKQILMELLGFAAQFLDLVPLTFPEFRK